MLPSLLLASSRLKLNAGHTSFYRTIDSSELLIRLTEAVQTSPDRSAAPALGVSDRLGLVGDVAAGVAAGMTSASDLLHLVRVCARVVCACVRVCVLHVCVCVCVCVCCVGARDPAVIAECLSRFDKAAAGVEGAVPADLRALVYATAAADGGAARWEQLLAMFKKATLSEEQRRLMTALGRASDPALLSKTLNLVLSEAVRSQDSVWVIAAVASNPGSVGRDLAWGFVKENWDHPVMLKLRQGFMMFAGIVGSAIGGYDSRAAADEISAWFKTHPAPSADRKIAQCLENIRGKVWRAAILRNDPMALPAAVDKILIVQGYTPLP